MRKNENCSVSDSALCKWVNEDCEKCYIGTQKDDEGAKKMLDDFMVTLSLLPEDMDSLMGQDCCFCVDKPQERVAYAVVDLGHSEPENKKGMFFGIGKKVRQRIGSLLPVSISICKRCRRVFRIVNLIKWVSMLVFLGIGVGLCFIPAINQNPALPYGVLIVAAVVGYIVGKVIVAAYIKKQKKHTRVNVFDIPVCAKMRELGWFTLHDDTAVTHFLFSRKPTMKKISDLSVENSGE